MSVLKGGSEWWGWEELLGGTSGTKLHLQIGKQTLENRGHLLKLGKQAHLGDSSLANLWTVHTCPGAWALPTYPPEDGSLRCWRYVPGWWCCFGRRGLFGRRRHSLEVCLRISPCSSPSSSASWPPRCESSCCLTQPRWWSQPLQNPGNPANSKAVSPRHPAQWGRANTWTKLLLRWRSKLTAGMAVDVSQSLPGQGPLSQSGFLLFSSSVTVFSLQLKLTS